MIILKKGWPLYTANRRKNVPFKIHNPYAEAGQLDYELTLRDQRMLTNLHKVPRKVKMSLRNHLTKRYPAVPLPNYESLDGCSNGDEKRNDDFLDLGQMDPYVGAR